MTGSPIFFPTVPERKPRTECGCQPVAFISSFVVTPLGRFSSSRTFSVLLPWRTAPAVLLLGRGPSPACLRPLAPFFDEVAFFPDLPLEGATWRARAAP